MIHSSNGLSETTLLKIHHYPKPLLADSIHLHHNNILIRDILISNQELAQKGRESTSVKWRRMRTFNLTWVVFKRCSVAVHQGAGARIWVWPWIIPGGSQLLQCRPVVYEFGSKSNIRSTSKDKFQSTLVSSAAAQPNRPHNTSLTSKLSGQNKTAGVMCSENVFTWYLTYGWHWILMWNIGYFISHIHKGRI